MIAIKKSFVYAVVEVGKSMDSTLKFYDGFMPNIFLFILMIKVKYRLVPLFLLF
jgi:hypothetical protein